jgi:hypothetical protein
MFNGQFLFFYKTIKETELTLISPNYTAIIFKELSDSKYLLIP